MHLKKCMPTVGLLAILVGCAPNPQAVSATAGQLISASSSWDSVADEFAASCLRRNQYASVPSNCVNEQQATDGVKAADKILAAYFTTLQQASTGSNFSVESGFTATVSSVKNIPKINTDQVNAATGLATYIADLATKALQERTLGQLIDKGAPDAEATINMLQTVVAPQLNDILGDEIRVTIADYGSYINRTGGSGKQLENVDCKKGPYAPNFRTGNSFLLAESYCTRISLISTKQAAVTNYAKSLSTAKQVLQDLQSGKDNLSASSLAQQLTSDASTLQADVAKIDKAF